MNAQGFELGDKVYWTSQAGGNTKRKEGVVVEVLSLGRIPDNQRFHKLLQGCGSGRNHQSYVVEVMAGAKNNIPKHYWPVVSCLRLIEGCAIKTVKTVTQGASNA
jgi:hypothetical protein